jgi:hypothetical protein
MLINLLITIEVPDNADGDTTEVQDKEFNDLMADMVDMLAARNYKPVNDEWEVKTDDSE